MGYAPSLQRRNRGEKSSCIKQLNGRYYLRKASFCQIFICKNFLFFEKTADCLLAKCQVIALFFLKIYINQLVSCVLYKIQDTCFPCYSGLTFKPVRRCLAVLSVLSAASSPCPDLNLIHYKRYKMRQRFL